MKKTLIERIEVGAGGAASILFDSIPDTFTDLVIKCSLRSSTSATDTSFIMKINDSIADTSGRLLTGTGSAVVSLFIPDQPYAVGRISAATATANTFGNAEIYIPNYASSSAKSFSSDSVSENNATRALQQIQATLWNQTAAITSLELYAQAGNLVEFSSASLYGISKGSDGTTTVS